ncbi:DUF1523 family protein [Thioclava sp. 'Guangxiensis']|uniref:DUF1523 family protein n=1 Tax=Thioclava sp. 'Guangxiensis' TaxID=3149044 RepID=UPI003877F26B
MRYFKWGFFAVLALLGFAFFHYTLPQHDIVRIVGTENRRIDYGEHSIFWASPSQTALAAGSRDVFFIQTQRPNGRPMVYRNEDTGWRWPPYFKFDSSNLQAVAQDLISTKADPVWVSITHYGWRNEWISIYPNAVAIKVVSGPDATIIPWANIIILVFLVVVILFLRALWKQFRRRSIDPVLEDMEEAWDGVEDRAEGLWTRLRRRLGGK